jgi:hypothetical protein
VNRKNLPASIADTCASMAATYPGGLRIGWAGRGLIAQDFAVIRKSRITVGGTCGAGVSFGPTLSCRVRVRSAAEKSVDQAVGGKVRSETG